MATDDNTGRVLRLLEFLLREAKITNTAVESRLCWPSGQVTRLFKGSRELRVSHLLPILGVVGVSPSRFFDIYERLGSLEDALEHQFPTLGRPVASTQVETPLATIPDDELEALVEAAFRRSLSLKAATRTRSNRDD